MIKFPGSELDYYKLLAQITTEDDSRFFVVLGPAGIPQLALNCNDLFDYACGDLEYIPVEMTKDAYLMTNDELTTWAEGVRGRLCITNRKKQNG